jgi:hypothetical protein
MVPGSILRYPSSFIGTTLYFSERKKPAAAVVTPFQIPEITQPVTIIYFFLMISLVKN